MTILEEIMKTILVAGAVIWVPCAIFAGCWIVKWIRIGILTRRCRRYVERNRTGERADVGIGPYEEEVVYE